MTLLRLGALAGFAAMGAGNADAADVSWKFYTYFAANDKPTTLHRAFAQDVEKATGGRLKITVFSAAELPYKASDVLRIVGSKQVEMGDVAFGFVAGDVPELNALSMPFSCTSMDKFYDTLAPAIDKPINTLLEAKFRATSIMQWVMPPQQLWLTKPANGIDGLKNLKVRSWNREQAEMMRLVGGSGVTITPAEVIPALQRGVVDGAFTAAVPALDWKFNEVTKFAYMMNLTLAHQAVVVNQAALQALPEDLRKTLLAKTVEWAPKYRAEMIAADKDARKTLAEKGMTLRDATSEEVVRLREITKPIADEWAAKAGPVGQGMLAVAIKSCS
ncbi:TRAP transporter substrate-binding protein DctP [Bosea sp. BK604]|uniref:TRAP transporter substrate-binding protein DctP n=1 Tax=Bosea sp. BK604 TaxID=2512180 RepID=UPI0014051B0E|nr:TRAP transporter substrate-binding protein DctP [Bosea sp. BK604]